MADQMKLIMENWRQCKLHEAEFEDCPNNEISLQDLIIVMGITTDFHQADLAREKALKIMDQMEISENREVKLNNIMNILGVIAGAAAIVNPPAGAAAAGVTGLVSAAAGWVGSLLAKSREEKLRGNGKFRKLLSTFCIDDATLDLIDNRLEAQYITQSGIMEKIKEIIYEGWENPKLEMPDLTKHLVDWINDSSEYSKSTATKIDYKGASATT